MQDLSQEERDKRFAAAAKKVEETNRQADEKAAKILSAEAGRKARSITDSTRRIGGAGPPRDLGKQLGLTEVQQVKIKDLQAGFRPQAEVLAALTAEQKAKWVEMQGKEFQFPQRQGRGFGSNCSLDSIWRPRHGKRCVR